MNNFVRQAEHAAKIFPAQTELQRQSIREQHRNHATTEETIGSYFWKFECYTCKIEIHMEQ